MSSNGRALQSKYSIDRSLFQAVLLEHAHVFIVGSNSTNVAEVLYAAAWICGEFSS